MLQSQMFAEQRDAEKDGAYRHQECDENKVGCSCSFQDGEIEHIGERGTQKRESEDGEHDREVGKGQSPWRRLK